MATGPEMMLKAFGIDPQAIAAEMKATIAGIQGGLNMLNTRLAAIEHNQKLIMEALEIEQPANGVAILPPLNKDAA